MSSRMAGPGSSSKGKEGYKKEGKFMIWNEEYKVFKQPKRGTVEHQQVLQKQKELKKEAKSKQVFESLVRLRNLLIMYLDSKICFSDDFQCCHSTQCFTLPNDLE